ncbi:unnamed protein product, partial [Mesorhabditis belari]|uniref:MIF4G domain-containing protein n=1 Tax=Mesorhabditis belari TaxID=2138241 RepID=A0AAF3FEY5_9BILA
MVDVTNLTLREWIPEIEHAIKKSRFVSIDYEFLGIPSSETFSLFDSLEQRYAKYAEAVRKFPPCQLGIACFSDAEAGTSYQVEVFSFPVFKRMTRKVFSFEIPAMKFLSKHKFDFNKLIADGISYSNKAEILRIQKEIEQEEIDYDIFADGLEHKLNMLKLRVLKESRDYSEQFFDEASQFRRRPTISESFGRPLRLLRPVLIELVANKALSDFSGGDLSHDNQPLWDRELSPVEAAIVVYELTIQHPNCEFLFDQTRTILYCAELPLMCCATKDNGHRVGVLLKNVIFEISGLSQIIQMISERKIQLVTHNSFLDLLYTYHCFENELPNTYAEWKEGIHRMFPSIIDTKVLAGTVQDQLKKHGVTDLSLQTLGNYFDSPSCGEIFPFNIPPITGGPHSQAIFTEGEHYHNAAFDALITGEIFIKLAYLYAYTRSAGQATFSKSWPLGKLVFACRSEIANRIPISMVNSLYSNLTDQDQKEIKPDFLIITPKKKVLDHFQHGLRDGFRRLYSFIIGPTKIKSEEFNTFRKEIRRRFGSHRVDVRLTNNKAQFEIATNTLHTYTKVSTWVITLDTFELPSINDMNQSYQPRVSQAFYDELVRRHEIRTSNRSKIRESVYFDEAKLRSLDSALKKTTTFMKKLKNIGAGGGPGLIEELEKLNLSKFTEEMAQAISEVRCKLADIPFIVDLAVAVACKYSTFSDLLLSELRKGIPQKKSDKVINPGKLRVDMRLLFELILNGVFAKEGLQVFGNALAYLVQTDKTEHINMGLLAGLSNQIGWEMARVVSNNSKGPISTDQLPLSDSISNEQALAIKKLLLDYHQSMKERAEKTCNEMNAAQKIVLRQEKHRGDATQEDKNTLDTCRQSYDTIKKQLMEMSDSLGITMPTFVEVPSDDEDDVEAVQLLTKALEEGSVTLWEDEEERYFYEKLIDIRRLVPTSLFKESQEMTYVDDQMEKQIEDIDMEDLECEHGEEIIDEQQEERTTTTPEMELFAELNDIEVESSATAIAMRNQMQQYLDELATCVNRDVVDTIALRFVQELNTKINRRRLVRFLFGSTSIRLDVVPFCARLLAILGPVMPDVPAELARLLIDRFREITRGKARDLFLDAKLRIVSFIAELVKFALIGRAEALSCLRQLVYDFRGHSVDLTCSMLESCGKYLYRNTDSHPKMKQLIDVILRKKELNKDMRQKMLIENAYYTVCPSETEAPITPPRPPIYDFVSQLIRNMNDSTLDVNLKLLRRIDWSDSELCDWAIWGFSSPWLIPFGNLCHISSSLYGLSSVRYHEWTSVEVVDNVLEIIRMALEANNDELNQKAIACMAYIGELYNYNVVNTSLIFKVLYQIVSFPEHPTQWADFTRIRMVSQLLRTIGEFFTKGSGKIKMDNFITYWLRYYWIKREQWVMNTGTDQATDDIVRFPPEIEGEIIETLKDMATSINIPKTLDDAEKKVQELEATFKEKIEKMLTGEFEDVLEDDGPHPQQRELHQIMEEDEEERKNEPRFHDEMEDGLDVEEMEDKQEIVNLHATPQKQQPEDLDFCRDLDQLLTESLKMGSTGTANQDGLIVPAQARQKLVRRVGFSDGQNIPRKEDNDKMRVALMTKGKSNKTVLKNIDLHEETLEQRWKANTDKEKEEREQMKKLTLHHTKRMASEEANEDKAFDEFAWRRSKNLVHPGLVKEIIRLMEAKRTQQPFFYDLFWFMIKFFMK